MDMGFDYNTAFSRNIGWVTEAEQDALRHKKVAIAGLGGVGGSHLLTLARLGVGAFSIADFDTFDVVNFNRQAGAMVSTCGRPKVEVLAEMSRDINPSIRLNAFPQGVTQENLAAFLDGVDLYVDGLDFFAFDIRRAVFSACHEMGIPAITAAPLGLGVAFLYFDPDGMSFEEYFCMDGCDDAEMALRFMLGLSPAMLQRNYLADPSRVDLAGHKGPSSIAGCQLCAGVIAAEALKLLINRGDVIAAPRGYQFDGYRNRFTKTWRPGGNRNPLQRIGLWVARRQLAKMRGAARRGQ
ncbi:MAG: ThiF family adenylyltransferase [Caldilineaceae bacterium]|nr:ThiF family adenylyltransferase [Caldilineaceae bacterium]MCB1962317.1 ThiF family adenylyltransferase [Rhodocyclaceae bacterium]